jgi:AAHS family 4-hydroxybenzoate transporter-like MFS transporter
MATLRQDAGRPGPASPPTVDICPLVDEGRWTGYQKLVLVMAALAVVLDGFDNQVLGFALPALTKEWNVSRAAFAPIFAMGFVGMTLGTMVGGYFGDRVGRRLSLIGAVVLFALATGATAFTNGVVALGVCRTIAGFGLGATMPNATTLLAEYSPVQRRSMAVTLGIVCIPLGGIIGGFLAARILPEVGWRALFVIGGIAPLVVAAILLAALPESPRYLARHPQRSRELAAILRRMGRDAPDGARFVDSRERQDVPRASVGTLFAPDYRRDTVGLWIAFFCCILGIYIVFSWMPSLLASAGFDLAWASTGLAVFNIGGVLGAIAGAWLMTHLGSRPTMLTTAALGVVGALVLMALPFRPADTTRLMVLLFLEGGFNNAAQTNLYALSAQVYPTQVRATGVGATAGVGRSGAIVSSFLGALALASGSASYFGMVAATMALTFVGLAIVRRHTPPVAAHTTAVAAAH